jgi:hypothetical protein
MNLTRMAVASTCLMLCATGHAATTYSLGGDFSNSLNPNGAWAFRQGSTALAHFLPSTSNATNLALSNGYWGTGSDLNTNTPEIGKVTVNGVATGGYTNADFLAGDVILHSTNPGTGAAITVDWIAPSAGFIDLAASTWYAHSGVSRSNDVLVTLGNVTLGTGVLSNSSFAGRNSALSFSFTNLAVAAGTVLSFRYTPTTGQPFGSIAGLSETVSFTASAVPDASTWATLSLGLALLPWLARRRVTRG